MHIINNTVLYTLKMVKVENFMFFTTIKNGFDLFDVIMIM